MLVTNRLQWLFWLSCFTLLLPNCQSRSTHSELLTTAPAGVIPVQIVATKTGYQVLRAGKPYYIKGVSGQQQLDRVKELGGNSVRLYTTNYADAVLDEAQKEGLTVMLGLWMKPEYEHFDYFDREAVASQTEEIRQQVLKFRHHPALLMWNVGNELDMRSKNPRSFQVLNDVVRMIHELDPYHPVTTTMSGHLEMVWAASRFCPDLDVLTINVFNQLENIGDRLVADGWKGPYIIGEFGSTGWWEAPKTAWEAPIEQSSTVKAAHISSGFKKNILGDPDRCLGSYVLYWGQRFEQTPMWFSLFTAAGEKTAIVDTMQHLWSGKLPTNAAPKLTKLQLNGQEASDNTFLQPGKAYLAVVEATDAEGDPLRVHWEVVADVNEMDALPQYRTAPEPISAAIKEMQGLQAQVLAPSTPGPYRLLVTVYDGRGSVATSSYPFYVGKLKPGIAQNR